ncbi:MAG: rhomboid family intramembrane serine protease [Aestuariivita sp.]|nr:rhomboid family intramembrane serine protease [Aestuariivita sp.]
MPENPLPKVFNPMPPVVVALFGLIAGTELLFTFGESAILGGIDGRGLRYAAIESYGVNTALLGWMVENNQYPLEHLARFVSFSFLHSSMISTAIACALFLAMGKMVGTVFPAVALLMFFFVPAGVGALSYSLAVPEGGWLFGSFTGIYGLIGAYTFMIWVSLKVRNVPQGQAFHLIAILMVVQLGFGMVLGDNDSWIADLSAFVTGFVLSFFFVPGGFGSVLNLFRKS